MSNLLDKRFLVIADYPESKFDVNDILIGSKGATVNPFYPVGRFGFANTPSIYHPEKWKHLFRELQWWETRAESEMPEYLKYKSQNFVFKPIKYLLPYDVVCPDEESGTFTHQLQNFIPATISEYSEYIKSKNKYYENNLRSNA